MVVLAAVTLLWLIAHALGDNVGELLCEFTFIIGSTVIVTALICLGIIWATHERVNPNVVLIAIAVFTVLMIPHFIISAKLAPAKWAFKLAVAERTANPQATDFGRIEAALAMRDEILRRSSAYSTWSGWKYDRHERFINVGTEEYPFHPHGTTAC
jgi:hypothetical protein